MRLNQHLVETFKSRLTLCFSILLLILEPPAYSGLLFSEPEQTYQHLMPSGDEFPGSVPKGAERINQTLLFSLHPRSFSELRLHFPPINRKSTGLYRVPGEPVTIRVDSAPGNTSHRRPFIRIGAHTDNLINIPPSQRKRVAFASDIMKLEEAIQHDRDWASGLIYFESNGVGTDSFEVTIFGGARAPWFKLGRDSLAQWNDEIRHYPAPWAELEGEHTILTLPSAMIRDLDDPIAVVTAYDQLVRDANALVGLTPDSSEPMDKAPDLPFRFVIDIQSDYGSRSHSEYPIVLWWLENDNPMLYLEPDTIRSGYILRHELGHNYEPHNFAFEPPGAAQTFANLFIFAYQYNSGHWFLDTRREGSAFYYYLPSLSYVLDSISFIIGEGYDRTIWNPDADVMPSKKLRL